MGRFLPIGLSVENRSCLVVGGGSVASRRVGALLDAGARVTVVSPEVRPEIDRAVHEWYGQVFREPYSPERLDGMFLVITATDDPAVNASVLRDARERGILCSDASSVEDTDFMIPSIIRRGDLVITVTTGGASPSLSARIRDELERQYGPEYLGLLVVLAEARSVAREQIPDRSRRQRALRAIAEDNTIMDLMRSGKVEEARQKALSWISSSSV
jgi:precorrin-2 dehydrogenase/sirohydrochlorin ferrochelatase